MPRQPSPHHLPHRPVAPSTAVSAATSPPSRTATDTNQLSTKPARKRCLNEGAHKLSY